jgi:hypothetical protein
LCSSCELNQTTQQITLNSKLNGVSQWQRVPHKQKKNRSLNNKKSAILVNHQQKTEQYPMIEIGKKLQFCKSFNNNKSALQVKNETRNETGTATKIAGKKRNKRGLNTSCGALKTD